MDYFSAALELILSVFPVVWNWFIALLDASGTGLELWVVSVFVILLFRFVVSPIFGWAGASDKAEASKAAKMKRDAAAQAKR